MFDNYSATCNVYFTYMLRTRHILVYFLGSSKILHVALCLKFVLIVKLRMRYKKVFSDNDGYVFIVHVYKIVRHRGSIKMRSGY